MIGKLLVDTGPLVALLNGQDQYHDWAITEWSRHKPPMLTCEAVISETCHLLRKLRGGSRGVLEHLRRQAIIISFRLDEEVEAIGRLITRYANIPMSLADACLVRMSEQQATAAILTIDRDFRVYRKNGRQVIPTVMPHEA